MMKRPLGRARSVTLFSLVLLSGTCQPASDLTRRAATADSTEPPPPPPPLPAGGTGDSAAVGADSTKAPAPPVEAVAGAPDPSAPAPDPPAGDCRAPTTPASSGQQQLRVFFTCGEERLPVTRAVPRTRAVLRSALEQLLRGPTPAERAAGFHSFFEEATAGALISVVVGQDGVARIDFEDFSRAIPNASSSAGSGMLLDELRETIFQYPAIRAAEITFEGSCDAFWNWLQRGCMQLRREG